MKEPIMKEEELVEIVNKQRNGKAAGVDGIKAEIIKHLIKNEKIREYLLEWFNKCINEKLNEDWLNWKTTMIPKIKNPKDIEHKPIAVTDWSSKVMCHFCREKIEEHLKECSFSYENQYGFTKGDRVEHCMHTLNYIANRTF